MNDSNFVGGKLKFKNPSYTNSQIQKIISKDIQSSKIKKQYQSDPQIKTIDNLQKISGCVNKNEQEYINILEEEIMKDDIEKANYKKIEPIKDDFIDTRTNAEKLFDERRLKRLPEKIRKNLDLNFKKKFENYNKLLSKLPEHYDIPKVGPG